jgi:hypothetical protein
MLADIDTLIRSSLLSLVDDIGAVGWTGRREREVVSLFCFGHLLSHCVPGAFLHDPTQVGIEVAVPQITDEIGLMSKGQVCKDVVIWPRPRMTCWDTEGKPTLRPASIVEWKHNEADVSAYDVHWLVKFSAVADDFVGYAVCTNQTNAPGFRLSCTRVAQGQAQPRWLFVE